MTPEKTALYERVVRSLRELEHSGAITGKQAMDCGTAADIIGRLVRDEAPRFTPLPQCSICGQVPACNLAYPCPNRSPRQ